MWNLIGAPDDADAFVERFPTKKAAVERGATILSWEDWDLDVARASLAKGSDCTMGDAGSLRVVKS